MIRLLCDKTVDKLPCPQHAIYGTSRCLEHQHDRRHDDAGKVLGTPTVYFPDLTPDPRIAEDATAYVEKLRMARLMLTERIIWKAEYEDALARGLITLHEARDWFGVPIRDPENPLHGTYSFKITAADPVPEPPSRRGWRRLWRRAA